MNVLHPKNIFPVFSPIYRLNGNRFISDQGKFQLIPIYVFSNIKYWTIFLYLNKQIFIFNKKDNKLCSYCVLQDGTLLSNYVAIWMIVNVALNQCNFKSTECHCWILWNQSWFVCTFKPHTINIQVLYLFVKKLFKAFICSPTENY